MTLSNNVLDLEVTRGDDIVFNFILVGLGSSGDVSEAVFSCKKEVADTAYVFQFNKSVDGAITKVDYDAQTDETTYLVKIPAQGTATLDLGTYYYDLQLTYNYTIITILKGKFVVTFDVTRNN